MINGELRSKIDNVWNAFWSGGVANPLTVIEQITYLLFIKRLDDLHTKEESRANTLGRPMTKRIFPEGKDGLETPQFRDGGCPYELMRWSKLRSISDTEKVYEIFDAHIFPFLRELSGDGTALSKHMGKARFGIPTPRLLATVVDALDGIPMEKKDTKGDLYEYMLAKIASAGQNGQFRTPRHLIELMVHMIAPKPGQSICDPAAGTAGFLVSSVEYLEQTYGEEIWRDADLRQHFETDAFTGFDFDETMLRIGAMNMLLHGVENPDIQYRDSLTEGAHDDEEFDIILANPPFSGSLDHDACSKDLQRIVKTKKTELLFMALFLKLLRTGGRAAVIVPAGVLESESTAHNAIRKRLVEDNRLEAVISLPHWVFKPYASVATAILIFVKSGKTDNVWYYKLENDGFSDDANKSPIPGSEIDFVLEQWKLLKTGSIQEISKKQALVSIDDIRNRDFDLCPNIYLSGYSYPDVYPLRQLKDFFTIEKGPAAASSADDGPIPFITTAERFKGSQTHSFDSEAICIPLVSATGHGHASIKTIHYVNGKFEAASIVAVLQNKREAVYVPYVYYYLLAHKDDLLVPLMRGAANVSLNLSRLENLRIPVPEQMDEQKKLVENLVSGSEKLERAVAQLSAETQYYANAIEGFRRSL